MIASLLLSAAATTATLPEHLVEVRVWDRLSAGNYEQFDAVYIVETIEDCGNPRAITDYNGGSGSLTLHMQPGTIGDVSVTYSDRSYQPDYLGSTLDVLHVYASPQAEEYGVENLMFADSFETDLCVTWEHQ